MSRDGTASFSGVRPGLEPPFKLSRSYRNNQRRGYSQQHFSVARSLHQAEFAGKMVVLSYSSISGADIFSISIPTPLPVRSKSQTKSFISDFPRKRGQNHLNTGKIYLDCLNCGQCLNLGIHSLWRRFTAESESFEGIWL